MVVWRVDVSVDEYKSRTLGYFATETLAKKAASKAGWWSSDGIVTPVNVFNNAEEWEAFKIKNDPDFAAYSRFREKFPQYG